MTPQQRSLLIFLLIAVPCSVLTAATFNVSVYGNISRQAIDGFGASTAQGGTGLTMLNDSMADLFFSPAKGIGISILRMELNNGYYGADEPEGRSGPYEVDWAKKAIAKGCTTIWTAPWSPPAAWKSNGQITNGGSLLSSHYQDYADRSVNYIKNLRDSLGINLYALSIQNEPHFAAPWESCVWSGAQMAAYIHDDLGPTLAANGLSTKIMATEVNWPAIAQYTDPIMNDTGAARYLDIVATHGYEGSATPYPTAASAGKKFWHTEQCNISVAWDPGMSTGLELAASISDAMTIAETNTWHYWNFINGDPAMNLGLTSVDGNGKITTTKRFFCLGNFSKFVRPGFVRIYSSGAGNGLWLSAFKNQALGQFVIVCVNRNGSDQTFACALNGITANNVTPWITSDVFNLAKQDSFAIINDTLTTTLPAYSVTTFTGTGVIDTTTAPPQNLIANADFSAGTVGWTFWNNANSSLGIDNGMALVSITNGGSSPTDVQLYQSGLYLIPGQRYRVSFKAKSTASRLLTAGIHLQNNPWTSYWTQDVNLGTSLQSFGPYSFVYNGPASTDLRINFFCGADNNNVWVDDVDVRLETTGTSIVDAKQGGAVDALSASPNPFNPETSLRFALRKKAFVTANIFDVRGKLVRMLINGELGAGPHVAVWNGRDNNGRALSSGIYIIKFARNKQEESKRIQLIK